jgi:hypothetical protein
MHQPSTVTQFRWDNSYAERLLGFYFSCAPTVVQNPVLPRFNSPLAEELGLNAGKLNSTLAAQIFSGTELPAGAQPLAHGLCRASIRWFCIAVGRWTCTAVGRGDRLSRTAQRYRVEGVGANAFLARR